MPKMPEGYKMRSFYLPEQLWLDLKAKAERDGRTLQKTVERGLQEVVAQDLAAIKEAAKLAETAA